MAEMTNRERADLARRAEQEQAAKRAAELARDAEAQERARKSREQQGRR